MNINPYKDGVTREELTAWAVTKDGASCGSMIAGQQTAIVECFVPPGLGPGGVVYIVEQNSSGKVVCRFTVTEVVRGRKDWIWARYGSELCMTFVDYWNYSLYRPTMCVVRFEKVQKPTKGIVWREDLGVLISPMWLTPVMHCKVF